MIGEAKHPEREAIQAFSIKAFSKAFKIGRTTVYAEIAKGRLIARKVGTRTLIAYDDAANWWNALPIRGQSND